MKLAVALLDFGGPRNNDELIPFLTELLADVLPGPNWFSRAIAPALARARAPKVRPQYAGIGWSPLVETHQKQAQGLRDRLGAALPVVSGMMFTAPTMDQAVAELQTLKPDGVIALSMFPHYSLATTHSAFHFFDEALNRAGLQDLPVHWIPAWFRHPLYIEALAESIRLGVQSTPGDGPLHLVFTPHGLPVSFLDRGDPYPDHIRASVDAVLRLLDWQEPAHIGWQSRVGPVAWLTPSTPDVLAAVAEAGGRRVCLVPISFLSEHIETLVEIDVEYREEAQKMGIPHWGRAPALGMADGLLNTLADLVQSAVPALSHAHCVRCLRLRTIVEPMRSKCPNCHFQPPKGLLDRPRPS